MDPRRTIAAGVALLGLLASLFWLWAGRARGESKRAAFRLFLLLLAAGLIGLARNNGVFAHSSLGFQLALAVVVLLVILGNLYAVRFCPACGRMQRNLKVRECRRCEALLPRHGLTRELRHAASDPTDPLGRRSARRALRRSAH